MVADVSALVASWIDEVHEALLPVSRPLSGAQWGPVTMAHATARPEWFASFDRAWARPWQGSDPDVALVSASFADLPSSVSPPPLRRGDLGPRGEVVGLEETDVRLVWQEAAGQVLGWDPATGRAVLLAAAEPSGYDQVSPLRFLVHWTAAASGGFLAHAATVGRAGHGEEPRGLLLLGDAGYGKSTTTLAALNHGWVTCGDDAVIVRPDARGWAAYAVYAAVKTKLQPGQDAPAGPDVVTWDIHGHKRAHLLTATDDRLLTPTMRIDGLLALDPAAPADRPWAAIDPAGARRVGAPNTVMPLPFDRAAVLARFGQACTELPARVLPRRQSLDDTVRDLGEIVDDVRPRVSVILPVYNGARFLARTIGSLLEQPSCRLEVIAVDDASTDDSREVLHGLIDEARKRGHDLRIVEHEINRGVAAARNSGIEAATSEFIAFVDQDDLWSPHHVELLLTALRRERAAAAFGRMEFVAIVPESAQAWMRREWFEGSHPGRVVGAGLFSRALFADVGPFDEDDGSGTDDVDWLMRLRDSGQPCCEVDDVVLVRQMHDANQSKTSVGMASRLLAIVRAHHARVGDRALPGLDVVIPVGGETAYLRAAVESALAQEGVDVQVILVNDGLDEDLVAHVPSGHIDRVRIVEHGERRGAGAARNTGVASGSAAWVAFLDADDAWPRGRSRALIEALDGIARGIAYGRQVRFAGAEVPDEDQPWPVDPSPPVPLPGALLVTRRAFEVVGPFEEDLRVGEGIDWVERARALGIAERAVDGVVLLRRSHGRNMTAEMGESRLDYLQVVARARQRNRSQ